MDQDPASLSNLNDIVLPPEVSIWPLAPGWWLLILATLSLMTWIACRSYKNWKANAYRREALLALESANDPATIVSILRRCALVIAPRSEVASQNGEAWPRWLASHASQEPPKSIEPLLVSGPYLQKAPNNDSIQQLKTYANTWIREHRIIATKKHKNSQKSPSHSS